MPDRKGRPGLLTPKHGDEASFILTSDPTLTSHQSPLNPLTASTPPDQEDSG